MATYKSQYTGQQIDQAVGNALNKDTSTLSNDVNHIPASSVVKSALDTFVRPNLLDNAYFVGGGSQKQYDSPAVYGCFPINQRGQMTYTGSDWGANYAIDRWFLSVASLTIPSSNDCINLTTTAAWGRIQQNIPTIQAGQTVTASCLIENNSDSFFNIIAVPGDVFVASLPAHSSGLYYGTVTLPSDVTAMFIASPDANATIKIKAAKLELGDTQTLAHQENGVWVLNEIPNYQQELAKCQRYFQTFRTQSLRPTYGADFRPVMATATPSLGTLTLNGITYYTASSEL